MRSLGLVIAIALLTFPALAASAPAERPDFFASDLFRESLDAHAARGGPLVDAGSLAILATRSAALGPGGIEATFDPATGSLDLAPILVTPDTSGESGCVLVSAAVGIGYHQSPVGAGDLATACRLIQTHPGGVRTMKLACTQSIYCYTAVSSVRGFLQLYCQFADATYVTFDPSTSQQTTLGDANCQVAATLLSPTAQWPNYVGFAAHFPKEALTVGLTNT